MAQAVKCEWRDRGRNQKLDVGSADLEIRSVIITAERTGRTYEGFETGGI